MTVSTTHLVFRNTLANMAGRFWPKFLAILLIRWLMPHLGEQGWAVYSLGVTIMLLGTVIDPGLQAGLVKVFAQFTAQGRVADLRRLVAVSLVVYLVLGVVLVVGAALLMGPILDLAGVADASRPEAARFFLCVLAHLALINVFIVFFHALFALQRMVAANTCLMLADLAHYAGVGAVILFGGGLRALGFVFIGAACLRGLLLTVAALPALPRLRPETPAPQPVSALLRHALPFGFRLKVVSSTETLATNWDKLFVSHFVGFASAGVYHVGWQAAVVLREAVRTLVSSLLPPATIAATASGEDVKSRMRDLNRLVSRWYFALAAPCFLFAAAAAPTLVTAWLGRPTPGAALVLRVLALAYFVHTAQAAAMEIGAACHLPHLQMRAMLAGAAAALALNFALTPWMGLAGPAVSALAGLGLGAALYARAITRALDDSTRDYLRRCYAPPLIAALAPTLLAAGVDRFWLASLAGRLGFLPGALLVAGLFFGFIALYGVTLLATGHFSAQDLRRLRRPK